MKHHRHRVIEGLPAALEGVLSSKSGIQQVKMVDAQPTICFGLFSEFVVFVLENYTFIQSCLNAARFSSFCLADMNIKLDWFFGKKNQENTGHLGNHGYVSLPNTRVS